MENEKSTISAKEIGPVLPLQRIPLSKKAIITEKVQTICNKIKEHIDKVLYVLNLDNVQFLESSTDKVLIPMDAKADYLLADLRKLDGSPYSTVARGKRMILGDTHCSEVPVDVEVQPLPEGLEETESQPVPESPEAVMIKSLAEVFMKITSTMLGAKLQSDKDKFKVIARDVDRKRLKKEIGISFPNDGLDWDIMEADKAASIYCFLRYLVSLRYNEQTYPLVKNTDSSLLILAFEGENWLKHTVEDVSNEMAVEIYRHKICGHKLDDGKIIPVYALDYALEQQLNPTFNPEICTSGCKELAQLGKVEVNETLAILQRIYQKNCGKVILKDGVYKLVWSFNVAKKFADELLLNGEVVIGDKSFELEDVEKTELNYDVHLTNDDIGSYLKELTERDFYRANITKYDIQQLMDPSRGSWDLYEDHVLKQDAPTGKIDYSIYARNPKADIRTNQVIGIDFGTKSTVVVRLEGNRTVPLRIGSGNFERELRENDFENPTVMQFIDIRNFWTSYQQANGRPMTRWEDLTISHTAYDAWNDNEETERYFSFFGELKQWAGTQGKRIPIRDTKDYELSLPPYEQLDEGNLDPIELYSYYIGLYINNQKTNSIHMRYLLSFPVTYDIGTRKHILESFERGLKKSLPESILCDEECMSSFSVEEGAAEPAAYAVCALQEFNLCPTIDDKVFYGVFDFGGGTTDFDFGIWRRANGPKERRYHFVLQHFGDDGDRYLGGENLLLAMAYRVFKDNQDKLLRDDITFMLPPDPQYQAFSGSEQLLENSQESHSNMQQLAEKLRPLWERTEGYEEQYESGVIKLRLFNREGEILENYELTVNADELENFLRTRIEQGVKEFFNAFQSVCMGPLYHKQNMKGIRKFHILLAGNSSRSEILKDIFRKEIKQREDQLRSELMEQEGFSSDEVDEHWIELYYPLGTEEAKEQVRTNYEDEAERPTGKTGVAIGLVQCRKGSRVKVINEKPSDEEIKFQFYIGHEDENGYFESFITRNTPYNVWVEDPVNNAELDTFEFHFTTLPSAELKGQLEMRRVRSFESGYIPQEAINDEWMVYLRCVGKDEIEYTVAESQQAVDAGNYKFPPVRLKLREAGK